MSEQSATSEAERPIESVGVLIIKDGRALGVRNKAGTGLGEGVFGIPGGKKRVINPETDKQAAIRELKQETGLIAKEEDLIEFPGNFFQAELPVNGTPKTLSWRVFICNQFEGELLEESPDEVTPEWMPVDKLHFYHTGPNILQVIQNGQEYLTSQSKETNV